MPETTRLPGMSPAQAQIVLDRVAAIYRVPVKEIAGQVRYPEIAHARRMAAFVMRDGMMTLEAIGSVLNKNHVTVIRALRKIDADASLKAEAQALVEKVSLNDDV